DVRQLPYDLFFRETDPEVVEQNTDHHFCNGWISAPAAEETHRTSVDARQMGGGRALGHTVCPPIRFPLVRVGTPDLRVAIRRCDPNVHVLVLSDGNL
ncbi:unnamed protein product, partial [Mycena citricolor]